MTRFFSVPNPTAAQNNKHNIGNRHNIWAATCESRGQTIISTEDRHLFSATQTYAAPPSPYDGDDGDDGDGDDGDDDDGDDGDDDVLKIT